MNVVHWCAKRSVLNLSSENLDGAKVSRQPCTESHIYEGNLVNEAEIKELSGCNASEGIEPRNHEYVGGRRSQ